MPRRMQRIRRFSFAERSFGLMAMVIVFLVIAPLTLWLLATRRSLTLLE